jgi:hypothetical protein
MSDKIGSMPNRMRVPGMRNRESSRSAHQRSQASHRVRLDAWLSPPDVVEPGRGTGAESLVDEPISPITPPKFTIARL